MDTNHELDLSRTLFHIIHKISGYNFMFYGDLYLEIELDHNAVT